MLPCAYWLLAALASSKLPVNAQQKGEEASDCPNKCTCTSAEGNSTIRSAICYFSFPTQVPLSITELTVNYLDVDVLDQSRLKEMAHLKNMDLSHCEITEIKEGTFISMHQLEVLKLSYNFIEEIKKDTFTQNTELRELYLNANDMKIIHMGAFDKLQKLAVVHLENNKLFQFPDSIPPSTEELYIQNNNMKSMPPNTMSLPNLKILNFCGNNIQQFTFSQINAPAIKILCLGNTSINIPLQTMQQMHNIKELTLNGENTPHATLSDIIQMELSKMITLEKLEIIGYSISNADFIINLTNLVTLCLKQIEKEINFHSVTFQNLHNLTTLDVSQSPFLAKKIMENPQLLSTMKNLQNFGLSNTSIQTLSEQDFTNMFQGKFHLDLSHNPLQCDCNLTWIVDKVDPYARGEIIKGEIPKTEIILQKPEDTTCMYPKALQGQEIMIARFCIPDFNDTFTISTSNIINLPNPTPFVDQHQGLSRSEVLYIVLGCLIALVLIISTVSCIYCLKSKKKGFHEIAAQQGISVTEMEEAGSQDCLLDTK